jgi:undecaprenyl-diphosphatase
VNNDYLLSVLLGIIEGLTEFLPVSSTAHLRISEALLGISLQDGFWKMYTIVIQLGAILALFAFFWRRLLRFLQTFPKGERGERNLLTHPLSLTLIAFVCTAVPALLMKKLIGKNLESIQVMAWALLIGGVVMWAVDWICRRPRILHMEEMGPVHAVWIGLVQTLSAIFPGTSRSMATIAAGQTAGLSRAAALEFSFFLSIPTMFAATGKELWETIHPKHVEAAADAAQNMAPLVMTSHSWIVLAIGFVVSFIVALGVVAWFMRWVQRHGFLPFAIYRIVLGVLLLSGVFGELAKH